MVLFVEAGGIGSTLLLLLAASGVGRITVVYHNYLEVSNLHWRVIHTNRKRVTSKAGSARNAMRDLNPNLFVTAVTEPFTW